MNRKKAKNLRRTARTLTQGLPGATAKTAYVWSKDMTHAVVARNCIRGLYRYMKKALKNSRRVSSSTAVA